jgi:Ca2+-binding RTX toxin-like protein
MTYIVLTTGDYTETSGGGDQVYGGLGNDRLIGSAGTDWPAGGGRDRFDRVRPAATQPPHRMGKVAFCALASTCC